jgi:3-oxoacyl-[acyl-carrier-protein] synthase III
MSVTHVVPERVVTNGDILTEFSARVGAHVDPATLSAMRKSLETCLEYAGSQARRHRQATDRAVDFGLEAGRRAIASAGLVPEDIDLLLYVGVGRGFIEPATANLFQAELGCRRATCFDILDACASWLRAVDVARHYTRCGSARHVLIVNCEFNFREYANWDLRAVADLETAWAAFTIGEAATATVLGPGGDDDDFHVRFENAGQAHDLCYIPLPNFDQFHCSPTDPPRAPLRFYSNSAPLTRLAVGLLQEQYRADPAFHGRDYDLILTHAASSRVAVAGIRGMGLDTGLFHDVFPRFGNTVSASLPLAMADAIESGRLQRGQRVLMLMGSAGVAAGLANFTY